MLLNDNNEIAAYAIRKGKIQYSIGEVVLTQMAVEA